MDVKLAATRVLGATGVRVPLIGYGTAPLGKKGVSRAEAVRCLNHAIDLGITYLDTSPDYGSEPHVGEVMKTRRREVFLATKINRRSKEGVLDEIKESLDRLQTDHVDLIQVHAVGAYADLEQTLAPDGAIAALEEARAQGLVRFVGITGHARPEMLAEALRRYPFDAVLIALGVIDRLISSPETFFLPEAQRRNVGVIAMKALGHGVIGQRELALRYSLSLPNVALAIVGMQSVQQIDEIAAIGARYEPPSQSDLDELIEEARVRLQRDAKETEKGGKGELFWLRDTKVTGWEYRDEPAQVEY
jgi:uncharacterized protein